LEGVDVIWLDAGYLKKKSGWGGRTRGDRREEGGRRGWGEVEVEEVGGRERQTVREGQRRERGRDGGREGGREGGKEGEGGKGGEGGRERKGREERGGEGYQSG
jgi:hypothetical protein